MSLALGGLFYNAEPYLQAYLKQLEGLAFPKEQLHLVFAVTRSSDSTESILQEYLRERGSEYASVNIVFRDKIAGEFSNELKIRNVAESYRLLVESSSPHDLVIIEQDNIVPKDSILRLTELNGDICAGLTFVVGGHIDYELKSGNVLRIEALPHLSAYAKVGEELVPISHPTPHFQLIYLPKELNNKVLKVGAVGTGLALIKRKVLNKIPFEHKEGYSQDLLFCKRAQEAGFSVMVDTSLWYEHLHYSYKYWNDDKGRLMVYFRDCNNAILKAKTTIDIGGLTGIIIPKEEVERQGVPIHKLKVSYNIPLE